MNFEFFFNKLGKEDHSKIFTSARTDVKGSD